VAGIPVLVGFERIEIRQYVIRIMPTTAIYFGLGWLYDPINPQGQPRKQR
jgi:hypothetical protein